MAVDEPAMLDMATVGMAAPEEELEAEMAVMMVPMAKIAEIRLLAVKDKGTQRGPLENRAARYIQVVAAAEMTGLEVLVPEMAAPEELEVTQPDMAAEVVEAYQRLLIQQAAAQVEKDIKALSN